MHYALKLTDEQLIPVPPIGLQISEEMDKRVGFFGHVILNISWDTPQLQSMYSDGIVTARQYYNSA